MSLINKVLTDLESRTDGATSAQDHKRVYDGLRPATVPRRRSYRGVWVAVLVIGAAGAGAFIGMQFWSKTAVHVDPPVTVQVPALPPVVALQPQAAQPAAAPASTAEPATVVPAPPAVAAIEPERPMPAVAPPAPGKPTTRPVRPKPAVRGERPHAAPQAQKKKRVNANTDVAKKDAVPGIPDMAKRPVPMTAQEQAENEYRAAVRAWQRRDVVGAEAKLKAALGMQADHAKARELLAAVMISLGRAGEAQVLLEQGLVITPAHYPFALILARLYVNQGAEPKAIAVLEGVRASGQRDPEYLGFLAALYQRANRYDDAIGAYRSALALRPQEGRWWMGLGICLEGAKNGAAAVEAYGHARAGAGMTPALLQYVEQRLAVLKPRRE